MSSFRIVASLMLVAGLAACRNNTAPVTSDISLSASSAGLVIVNTTSQPIHTLEMESGSLALVDPKLCDGTCSVQQPGATRVVPWQSILGYSPERSDYIVYWFPVMAMPDGSQRSGATHITKLYP